MRTPLTILALGLGACLALGLMMQHLLRVSKERNQPPVVREINRVYGARMDGEARMRFVRRPDAVVAEITFTPLVVGGARDLAREIGQFVWRNVEDPSFAKVVVVCADPLGGAPQQVEVHRPYQPGAPPRRPPPKLAPEPRPIDRPAAPR